MNACVFLVKAGATGWCDGTKITKSSLGEPVPNRLDCETCSKICRWYGTGEAGMSGRQCYSSRFPSSCARLEDGAHSETDEGPYRCIAGTRWFYESDGVSLALLACVGAM